jgi:hypothetical protein|tara:strand:+ start:58 stop:237 length:180 start_codon:yes stop_codon:yes gene_type:complete
LFSDLVLPKKSQDLQELFDMGSRRIKPTRDFGMANKKALLIIVIAGAIFYYFAIHRRRK